MRGRWNSKPFSERCSRPSGLIEVSGHLAEDGRGEAEAVGHRLVQTRQQARRTYLPIAIDKVVTFLGCAVEDLFPDFLSSGQSDRHKLAKSVGDHVSVRQIKCEANVSQLLVPGAMSNVMNQDDFDHRQFRCARGSHTPLRPPRKRVPGHDHPEFELAARFTARHHQLRGGGKHGRTDRWLLEVMVTHQDLPKEMLRQ